jgi:predicted membrane protein
MADNKKTKKPVLGWIFIGLGLLILIKVLGINIIIPVISQWHIGLILIGIALLLNSKPSQSRTMPYVLMGIGAIFFLKSIHLFHFSFDSLIVPIILLVAGFHYLGSRNKSQDPSNENSVDTISFLSGVDHKTHSQNLEGGSVTSILGGAEINLSDAEMSDDYMELHVLALMGGIDIRVPLHWQVNSRAIPILGGVSNETNCLAEKLNMKKKTLIIKGIAIMGGINIKN